MLHKFKVSIDGKEHLVEVEGIGGVPQPAPVAPQPTVPIATAETPAPAVEETPVSAVQPATPARTDTMPAPMLGAMLKALINIGDMVPGNQPLLILEAAKVENEIVVGKAGTAAGIHVTQDQIANPEEPLVTIN